MKIEPVRGWAVFWGDGTFTADEYEVKADGEVPVLVIPLDSESIEDKREIVNDLLLDMTDVEDFDYWEAAKTILAAIGITEEE